MSESTFRNGINLTDRQCDNVLAKYDLLRYESRQNVPHPRWILFLNCIFRLNIGYDRSEAFGSTYADLARHVTIYGIEPGYRAVQTKENGGRGLDFYSLDPERDPEEIAFTWRTDTDEPK